jgi:hypothetical protein
MNFADVARVTLDVAFATRAYPVSMTVRHNQASILVRDHRVTVELWYGILRVIYVHPAPGDGPATRDARVPMDDADAEVVGAMVRSAVAAGLTAF